MRPRPWPGGGRPSSAAAVGATSTRRAPRGDRARDHAAPDDDQRDVHDLGLEAAVAALVGVAVVGDDDDRVLVEVDPGEGAAQRAVGGPRRLGVLGAGAAVLVAGGVDDADQQDDQVVAAGDQAAGARHEPAGPRRVAGVVEGADHRRLDPAPGRVVGDLGAALARRLGLGLLLGVGRVGVVVAGGGRRRRRAAALAAAPGSGRRNSRGIGS